MVLGVIGCGKMGSALVTGAVRSGVIKPEAVYGMDTIPAAVSHFTAETGANACDSLVQLAAACDTFLLATKPQDVGPVLKDLAQALQSKPALVISIAAGLKISTLESYLPENVRVIRTMPNTPALVGQGASAFSPGSRATSEDSAATSALLSSVGLALEVKESLLDAVTGLSGSGPAYGFLMIEALSDAGVRCGLPRPEATQLAAQTLLGAATMVLQTGMHPGALKDMVTSPGGTTIAGLAALEKNGLRFALIDAVTCATKRSIELSNPS
jgi:pyrroline-5-carboxylate reductase